MSTILRKGIIRGGQVVVEEPIDLPDGAEVTNLGRYHGEFLGGEDDGLWPTPEEIVTVQGEIEFLTEDEQGDDPEVVQQWIDDLRSIPPVPENPESEAAWRTWDEKMRHHWPPSSRVSNLGLALSPELETLNEADDPGPHRLDVVTGAEPSVIGARLVRERKEPSP